MKDENLSIRNKLVKAKDVLRVIHKFIKSNDYKVSSNIFKFKDIYNKPKIVHSYCITNFKKNNWVLIRFVKLRNDESRFKQYIEYIRF